MHDRLHLSIFGVLESWFAHGTKQSIAHEGNIAYEGFPLRSLVS